MDRSPFPTSSDEMPEPAHDEQAPGVDQNLDQPNPWSQKVSGGPPPRGSQPHPTTGFIRRPAGWTPVQAGHGVYTPHGSSTPLSATFYGYDISRAMGPAVDAPPPGSGPPVTHESNLVGARVQVPSTSLPLWEFKCRHAPLWAMPLRSRIRQCDSGHSGRSLPMPSLRNGQHHRRCHRPGGEP